MPNYDFKQLSPYDFELISRDVIQAREQIFLESFKTGKDDGIDFRHAGASGASIVQCKHYAESGLAKLLRDLSRESAKVAKLQPTRYILITSVALSPHNKTTIQNLFSIPLASADILGKDDINNLLAEHPGVEMRHYKLWLASKAVLDRALHNASMVQSEFEVERVYRDISGTSAVMLTPERKACSTPITSPSFQGHQASVKRRLRRCCCTIIPARDMRQYRSSPILRLHEVASIRAKNKSFTSTILSARPSLVNVRPSSHATKTGRSWILSS